MPAGPCQGVTRARRTASSRAVGPSAVRDDADSPIVIADLSGYDLIAQYRVPGRNSELFTGNDRVTA
jgi:hypothetical protein